MEATPFFGRYQPRNLANGGNSLFADETEGSQKKGAALEPFPTVRLDRTKSASLFGNGGQPAVTPAARNSGTGATAASPPSLFALLPSPPTKLAAAMSSATLVNDAETAAQTLFKPPESRVRPVAASSPPPRAAPVRTAAADAGELAPAAEPEHFQSAAKAVAEDDPKADAPADAAHLSNVSASSSKSKSRVLGLRQQSAIIDHLKKENFSLRMRILHLESEMDAKDPEAAAGLRKQYEDIKEYLAKIEKEYTDAYRDLGDAQATEDQLRGELAAAQRATDETRSALAAVVAERDEALQAVRALQDDASRVAAERSSQTRMVEAERLRIAEAERELAVVRRELDEQRGGRDTAVALLRDEAVEMQAEAARRSHELEAARTQAVRAEEELARSRQLERALRTDLESVRTAHAAQMAAARQQLDQERELRRDLESVQLRATDERTDDLAAARRDAAQLRERLVREQELACEAQRKAAAMALEHERREMASAKRISELAEAAKKRPEQAVAVAAAPVREREQLLLFIYDHLRRLAPSASSDFPADSASLRSAAIADFGGFAVFAESLIGALKRLSGIYETFDSKVAAAEKRGWAQFQSLNAKMNARIKQLEKFEAIVRAAAQYQRRLKETCQKRQRVIAAEREVNQSLSAQVADLLAQVRSLEGSLAKQLSLASAAPSRPRESTKTTLVEAKLKEAHVKLDLERRGASERIRELLDKNRELEDRVELLRKRPAAAAPADADAAKARATELALLHKKHDQLIADYNKLQHRLGSRERLIKKALSRLESFNDRKASLEQGLWRRATADIRDALLPTQSGGLQSPSVSATPQPPVTPASALGGVSSLASSVSPTMRRHVSSHRDLERDLAARQSRDDELFAGL